MIGDSNFEYLVHREDGTVLRGTSYTGCCERSAIRWEWWRREWV
jgi:hypothetical protein